MDFEVNEILKDGGCVGLAQINPIAGNLEYNSNKIIDFIKQAESLNLDMVLFPKNALLGFNMPDFINRFPFILEEAQKWLEKIAIQAIAQDREAVVYVHAPRAPSDHGAGNRQHRCQY